MKPEKVLSEGMNDCIRIIGYLLYYDICLLVTSSIIRHINHILVLKTVLM